MRTSRLSKQMIFRAAVPLKPAATSRPSRLSAERGGAAEIRQNQLSCLANSVRSNPLP